MRISYILAATVAVLFIGVFILWPAFAQETGPVISPSSIWYELWTIVQPIIVLLVSTVGPALVTWLSVRLIALLNISDEKQRVEIEARLRVALHESAINALKYAVTRTGLPLAVGSVPGQVVDAAIEYVRQKNPEALEKLGVDLSGLQDIIISKVPEVVKAVN